VPRNQRVRARCTHNIGRAVTVGHVVLPNRARRAVLAGCGPRLSRVHSSSASTAGTDQPSRKGSSRADHAGTESSSSIVSYSTCRAITRPLRCCQADPAPLARQGAPLIRWMGVLAGLTGIAHSIPAQHGRGGPEGARGTVQIRRVTASNTSGKQVVLASRAQDAGPPLRAPPSRDARAVEPVERERRAERALGALGLHPSIAIGWGLAGHARRVVDALPAQIACTGCI
jgi:hypothetical protein